LGVSVLIVVGIDEEEEDAEAVVAVKSGAGEIKIWNAGKCVYA
jgi:hypothetical protein